MKTIINIADLIGTDIRSRINANTVRREISKNRGTDIVLDLSGVTFISRSFTDELFNIVEYSHGTVELSNMTGTVKVMIDAVAKSRSSKRVRPKVDQDVIVLEDMESLKKYFATF